MTAQVKTWIVMIIITVVEAVPLILTAFRRIPHFLKYLGFYPGSNHGTYLSWILASLTVVVFTAYVILSLDFIRANFSHFNFMKIFAIFVFAPVTGIFEETYFRRVLMNGLAAHHVHVALQVVLSAVLFGFAHTVWALFRGTWQDGRNAMLSTAVLGGLLGCVYVVSGRSLAPCIATHAAINALIEPWLILAASYTSAGRPRSPNIT